MDRATYARDYFIQKGYSPIQAAAIVGNLMQESYSDLRTGAVGDKGISHGIAQWNKDRYTNLKNFASQRQKPWDDFDTQLAFVDNELRGKPNSGIPGAGSRASAWNA